MIFTFGKWMREEMGKGSGILGCFFVHKTLAPQPYKCLVILHVIIAIILIHSTHSLLYFN